MLYCVLDIGGCYSNPCLGSSTCVPIEPVEGSTVDYKCECPGGITGTNCGEFQLDGFNYFVFGEQLSWQAGRDDCSRRGYLLASVLTAETHEMLNTFVKYD